MSVRSNPYSTELAMLRDYLSAGFDPYDWGSYLEAFYDEERGGEYPPHFVSEAPEDSIPQMSAADLKDFKAWTLKQSMDYWTPSTRFFEFERVVPRNTWLIHFTDNPADIIREGFKCGTEDMRTLGLTTWFVRKGLGKKCLPGWNFAFDAKKKDAKRAATANGRGKYGFEAVMFQSAGVEAYHTGDEEHQVIFWGPAVPWVIPLWESRDGNSQYQIMDHDEKTIYRGYYDDVVPWVIKNHRQYFDSIAYVTEGH